MRMKPILETLGLCWARTEARRPQRPPVPPRRGEMFLVAHPTQLPAPFGGATLNLRGTHQAYSPPNGSGIHGVLVYKHRTPTEYKSPNRVSFKCGVTLSYALRLYDFGMLSGR